MKMKKYKTGILALVMLAAGATQASAATINLFDWAFNLDGTMAEAGYADPVPSYLNDSAFDWTTGLGTLTATITGSIDHSFTAFFDHEIDESGNTFFNEFGAVGGSAAAVGQSWEIDEPGYVFGDIYDNVVAGNLDGTNGVPSTAPDDVSMAMDWDFNLTPGKTAYITLSLSTIAPTTGFYLSQVDPDSQAAIYFSSNLVIRDGGTPPPVPEPATMLLLGTGLAGLCGLRRKKRS